VHLAVPERHANAMQAQPRCDYPNRAHPPLLRRAVPRRHPPDRSDMPTRSLSTRASATGQPISQRLAEPGRYLATCQRV